jgi:acetate---CoA ligase (ADP-forming) subunit beta
MMDLITSALEAGHRTLSEYDSKRLLSAYRIPVVKESIVKDWDGVKAAAESVGYPAVLKLCAPEVVHKSEHGLIATHLRDEAELERAFNTLNEKAADIGGDFLVQEMVYGVRELVIGMIRDPQFGPCVMFGLGGIFTEILNDVSFRVAPIDRHDALEMLREIKGCRILDAVRGLEAVDRDVLGESLIALGNIGLENDAVAEIDVNPMIVQGNRPVAVDALVVLAAK